MDKYLEKSTLEILNDEHEHEHEHEHSTTKKTIVLGVLGHSSSSKWTRDSIAELLMNPVLGDIGEMPESILIPTEGTTSIFLEMWAGKMKIPCQPIDTNWARMGRKARAVRDSKIMKESTHLVFFLGTRSDYYEKIAIREVKKGIIVYTIDPKTNLVEHWV